jgi:hypothetical protein
MYLVGYIPDFFKEVGDISSTFKKVGCSAKAINDTKPIRVNRKIADL